VTSAKRAGLHRFDASIDDHDIGIGKTEIVKNKRELLTCAEIDETTTRWPLASGIFRPVIRRRQSSYMT
jgi:hypothetical protein